VKKVPAKLSISRTCSETRDVDLLLQLLLLLRLVAGTIHSVQQRNASAAAVHARYISRPTSRETVYTVARKNVTVNFGK